MIPRHHFFLEIKSPPPHRKPHHRAMTLGKRRSGLDDAPSAVEIMKELSDDMQAAFDAGDAIAVDRIYEDVEADGNGCAGVCVDCCPADMI